MTFERTIQPDIISCFSLSLFALLIATEQKN